jgi:hypothetical protein
VGLAKVDTKEEMVQDHHEEALTGADVVTVTGKEAYLSSVWEGRDGKGGWACKVWVEPMEGETIEQAAQRANKFAVAKLRELETAMGE